MVNQMGLFFINVIRGNSASRGGRVLQQRVTA
jgi:hypothetical protein